MINERLFQKCIHTLKCSWFHHNPYSNQHDPGGLIYVAFTRPAPHNYDYILKFEVTADQALERLASLYGPQLMEPHIAKCNYEWADSLPRFQQERIFEQINKVEN